MVKIITEKELRSLSYRFIKEVEDDSKDTRRILNYLKFDAFENPIVVNDFELYKIFMHRLIHIYNKFGIDQRYSEDELRAAVHKVMSKGKYLSDYNVEKALKGLQLDNNSAVEVLDFNKENDTVEDQAFIELIKTLTSDDDDEESNDDEKSALYDLFA